jgi:hypothetical protein
MRKYDENNIRQKMTVSWFWVFHTSCVFEVFVLVRPVIQKPTHGFTYATIWYIERSVMQIYLMMHSFVSTYVNSLTSAFNENSFAFSSCSLERLCNNVIHCLTSGFYSLYYDVHVFVYIQHIYFQLVHCIFFLYNCC